MFLHKGLIHIHSQEKPRLRFGESFALSDYKELLSVLRNHLVFSVTMINVTANEKKPAVLI